jgi:UPF0176 protein
MAEIGPLLELRDRVKGFFAATGVRGTVIIADEGFNGMVCGSESEVDTFVPLLEDVFATTIDAKVSYHTVAPFRKIDVKVKPEIVTLKVPVDLSLGVGTHVAPEKWNDLISDPNVIVLDTRNDYEYHTGTFEGAINPEITKFSDFKEYVEKSLDPNDEVAIATFCTGGIRCEKAVPLLKGMGFKKVFQLEGGILKYLENVPKHEQLWIGECYVFDERTTVNSDLEKGSLPDVSMRHTAKESTE